jgi:hypothetical protein
MNLAPERSGPSKSLGLEKKVSQTQVVEEESIGYL